MNTPFFKLGIGILLISCIIFMLDKIDFIFEPLILLVKTLLMPFLIAGILYYLFYPVMIFLQKKGLNRLVSIFLIFFTFIGSLLLSLYFLGPLISKQIKGFIAQLPSFVVEISGYFKEWLSSDFATSLSLSNKIDTAKIIDSIMAKVNASILYISENIVGIASTITGTALLFIVVPIILFYLLKDGEKLPELITWNFRIKTKKEVRKILTEVNFALGAYIKGQLIVSIIIGILIYIGFLIIGLDYALLLGVIAMFTNFIPLIGPFIGLGFALLVAFMDSLHMALLVTIVVLIVQQIEGNLISPNVMGKRLDIHPLTIILLLLFATRFSIIWLIIAVPTYAASKIVIVNGYRIWKERKNDGRKEHPY